MGCGGGGVGLSMSVPIKFSMDLAAFGLLPMLPLAAVAHESSVEPETRALVGPVCSAVGIDVFFFGPPDASTSNGETKLNIDARDGSIGG